MRKGYSIRLSIITDEEAEELLENSEWRQTTKNEDMAMFDKMYDTEQ